MTSQIRRNAGKILLSIFLLSLIAAACNNKKEKKDEKPVETPKLVAPQGEDTIIMDKDTADTRPVLPVDPVKPGE